MKWTQMQQKAIDHDGQGIVSAAAGAGKTAVLTERVVRLCRDGIALDNMLVLTFTRAAAAEMKARIAAALQRAAKTEADGDKQAFLYEQADCIAGANISTIHSFCKKIISRHFHLVGLSGSERTMDESESAAMQQTAMDRALLELASSQSEQYRKLLGGFDSEVAAVDNVKKLYNFLSAQPQSQQWLEAAITSLKSEEGIEKDETHITRLMQEELSFAVDDMISARNKLSVAYAEQICMVDDELSKLRGALVQPSWVDYREALMGLNFDTLKFPNGTQDEHKRPILDARTAVKKCIKAQQAMLSMSREDNLKLQRQSAELLDTMRLLLNGFIEAYSELKGQKSVIDYNDLEHFALEILQDERIKAEYRKQIKAIIVDEYQDSNRVQEAILQAVSTGDNIFLVGDVKQSIYGFRLAEPSLFLEKYDQYPHIDLSHNFRSSQEVIDLVNHVFSSLMRRPLSPVDYIGEALLRRGCEQEKGEVSLHLIEKISDGEQDDIADSECQARFVAEQIKKRMAKGKTKYSDVVILLRSTKNARIWAQTLSLYGIPCYAQLSGGYFNSIEVMVVLNMLRLIDNRRQDIPLISVMRSPFGGFSDEQLALLRIGCPKGDILDCLLAAKERGEKQASDFLEFIAYWQRESRLNSVEELVAKLLEQTAFYDEMGAVQGGEQRQANLDALIDKAAAFDEIGSGVQGFLSFMEGVEKNARTGAAQMEQADVVSIITIHKAKGLEFPVVFLGNLEQDFVSRDISEPLQVHSRYGAALRFIDTSCRVRRDTLRHQILRKELKKESLQEEMRVLYVALTRAKEQLIMVGSLKNAQVAVDNIKEPTKGNLYNAKGYLPWLMMTCKGYLPMQVYPKSKFVSDTQTMQMERMSSDEGVVRSLKARLNWAYPHSEALSIPQKTSVTALSKSEQLQFRELKILRQDDTPTYKGTATHTLLQRVARDGATLEQLMELRDGDAELKGAYVEDVSWFLSTPLFERMRAAQRLEKELSFCYAADTKELLGLESNERVLVQGVIDACFVEDGAWVLLDYKTDAVGYGEEEAVANRHRVQVETYAKALQELSKLPVKERYVVLLKAHKTVAL